MVQGGCNPLFSNRRGSIISYNFIRKNEISKTIKILEPGQPLFQKFRDPALLNVVFSAQINLKELTAGKVIYNCFPLRFYKFLISFEYFLSACGINYIFPNECTKECSS